MTPTTTTTTLLFPVMSESSRTKTPVYRDDIDSGTIASHLTVTARNTTAERENCTLGHRLCSMNGVHFVICITQTFPVERLVLIGLANEHPFVTIPISEMDNSRKSSLIGTWPMFIQLLARDIVSRHLCAWFKESVNSSPIVPVFPTKDICHRR
jgi:hypothetical protein